MRCISRTQSGASTVEPVPAQHPPDRHWGHPAGPDAIDAPDVRRGAPPADRRAAQAHVSLETTQGCVEPPRRAILCIRFQ